MIRNLGLFASTVIVRVAVSVFVLVPVTTYYLTPADFGIFGLLTALSGFAMVLGVPSAAWVLSADFHRMTGRELDDLLATLFWGSLIGIMVSALVIWAAANTVLLPWLGDLPEDYQTWFVVAVLGSAASGLWQIASAWLMLRRDALRFSATEILSILANLAGVTLALVWAGMAYPALFIGFAAMNGVLGLGCLLSLNAHLRRGRFQPSMLMRSFRFGLKANLIGVSESGQSAATRSIIGLKLGLGPLGIYTHSDSYRGGFVSIAKVFVRVFTPEIVAALNGKGKPGLIDAQMRLFGFLFVIGGLAVGFLARPTISLLTHGNFVAATPLAQAWYLLAIIHLYGTAYMQALVHQRRAWTLVWTAVIPTWLAVLAIFLAAGDGNLTVIAAIVVCAALTTALLRRFAIDAQARIPGLRHMVLYWAFAISLAASILDQHPWVDGLDKRLGLVLIPSVIVAVFLRPWRSLRSIQARVRGQSQEGEFT